MGGATKKGSCGFMGPKVMQACAKVLPRLLSTATGRGRSRRSGRSGQYVFDKTRLYLI